MNIRKTFIRLTHIRLHMDIVIFCQMSLAANKEILLAGGDTLDWFVN